MYRPRGEDPFPKPRAYAENYTRLRGNVSGLSSQQVGEARGHATAPAADGSTGADSSRDPRSTEPVATPTQQLPHPRGEAIPGKRPLTLVVDTIDKSGFRGETVHVSGHAGGAVGPPVGLRVDVYLTPAGTEGDSARIIGQAVTDGKGAFSISATLPPDLGLGEHEVYALTAGNEVYSPAISE
jgi:hypothetical protein